MSEYTIDKTSSSDSGFTLIEVVIAMIVILVALLGVTQVFTYAIAYNSGNKARSQALTVMQEEVELLRSKKFTPTFTDPALSGGTHTKTVTTSTGYIFNVEDVVDNEPLVNGVQDDTYTCLSPQGSTIPCSIKEITITVTLTAPSPGWQLAVPAKTVLRRTRGN